MNTTVAFIDQSIEEYTIYTGRYPTRMIIGVMQYIALQQSIHSFSYVSLTPHPIYGNVVESYKGIFLTKSGKLSYFELVGGEEVHQSPYTRKTIKLSEEREDT